MFASRTTKIIRIPDGDETVAVTIRKLSWKSLDEAEETKTTEVIKAAGKVNADLIKAFTAASDKPQGNGDGKKPEPVVRTPQAMQEARYGQYDKATVLAKGVQSWTAKESVGTGVNDLDPDVSEMLFREILDLSLPPLSAEEVEQKMGEGSAASTGS